MESDKMLTERDAALVPVIQFYSSNPRHGSTRATNDLLEALIIEREILCFSQKLQNGSNPLFLT